MGRRGTSVAAVAVALALGAAGCSDVGPQKRPDTRATAGSGPPLIMPGEPGAPASTATPGQRVGPGAARPGGTDIRFAQLMIPHHQQAIEMATLAGKQAGDAEVRGIAGRIVAAQNPEIAVLRQWLKNNGRPAGAAHGGMPGMASPQQIAELRAATGRRFDRLFLRLMITHHEGALTMALDEIKSGRDPYLVRIARDVHATQSAEIQRMRPMLGG
jgi:uncharacterized protein (DUF305 family)